MTATIDIIDRVIEIETRLAGLTPAAARVEHDAIRRDFMRDPREWDAAQRGLERAMGLRGGPIPTREERLAARERERTATAAFDAAITAVMAEVGLTGLTDTARIAVEAIARQRLGIRRRAKHRRLMQILELLRRDAPGRPYLDDLTSKPTAPPHAIHCIHGEGCPKRLADLECLTADWQLDRDTWDRLVALVLAEVPA